MTSAKIEHLQNMANQIAANFSYHEDRVDRIGDHLTRFWAPSMRRELLEHVKSGGDGLHPAALEAVRRFETG
jgi:formate dehydrogenase subunit delta